MINKPPVFTNNSPVNNAGSIHITASSTGQVNFRIKPYFPGLARTLPKYWNSQVICLKIEYDDKNRNDYSSAVSDIKITETLLFVDMGNSRNRK